LLYDVGKKFLRGRNKILGRKRRLAGFMTLHIAPLFIRDLPLPALKIIRGKKIINGEGKK
jgi:hypothetical protein